MKFTNFDPLHKFIWGAHEILKPVLDTPFQGLLVGKVLTTPAALGSQRWGLGFQIWTKFLKLHLYPDCHGNVMNSHGNKRQEVAQVSSDVLSRYGNAAGQFYTRPLFRHDLSTPPVYRRIKSRRIRASCSIDLVGLRRAPVRYATLVVCL